LKGQVVNDDVRTVRVRIEGHVQGVGFRYWTEVAAELHLSGWVRNRRDGAVEAMFSGTGANVAAMLERCRRGPPAARITSLIAADDFTAPPTGFEVLQTL
jgi:acylphosphatase